MDCEVVEDIQTPAQAKPAPGRAGGPLQEATSDQLSVAGTRRRADG
jgi:hypothetical protein